ncbi:MAG: S9 family peptidase [Merismopedia sp. SIO2A8]|nr:S9 family peptidase [Merismopedia sp. SIO2A8]
MSNPELSSLSAPFTPPVAKPYPNVLETHGDRRIDPYYWMRDRNHPELIPYLEAENAYTQAQMAHTAELQAQLYDEMLGRIQETDLSVPYRHGPYFYYNRTEEGKAYSIFCRQLGSEEPDLEGDIKTSDDTILDQNALAEGESFFSLGTTTVSPDHAYLAYSTDTNGSESYTLYVKDLARDSLFPERIAAVDGVAWANDSQTLLYTKIDQAHRPFQVWRHQVGTDPKTDELVYEEPDDSFYLNVSRTRSSAYILLTAESKITSEIRFLNADHPTAPFQLIQQRLPGVEYAVEHHPGEGSEASKDCFYIVTNADGAINFKLMVAPVSTPGKEHWRTVLPHRPQVMLKAIDVFAHHLVRYERERGLPTIQIQALPTTDCLTPDEHQITFPEPTYSVYAAKMPEFDTHILRFTYTSLITPSSVFDYDMDRHQRQLKKETPVLGGYKPEQYRSEWLMAIASDGTEIPISLIAPKDCHRKRISVGAITN